MPDTEFRQLWADYSLVDGQRELSEIYGLREDDMRVAYRSQILLDLVSRLPKVENASPTAELMDHYTTCTKDILLDLLPNLAPSGYA